MLKLHRNVFSKGNFVIKKRYFSLKISEEVRQGLLDKRPIVALESTVITHGLKYPENLHFALKVEDVIRENGAIPATMAFINGEPVVGASKDDISLLAERSRCEDDKKPVKVSRRDIPHVMSKRLMGGTTIASTMILAHKVGIDVFATGGLGGVHRGVELTMDVSADLDELGKTPVGVICSGPKSILDIPRTIEYLETKGVYVSTLGPKGTNIPGFFTSDSGVSSPYNFETPREVAEIIYNIKEFNLSSGSVFCVPASEDISLPKQYMDEIISEALAKAEINGIVGKHVTPFLLGEILQKTGGKSLETNVAFLLNNATFAAKVSRELTAIQLEKGGIIKQPSKTYTSLGNIPKKVDCVIVGGLAIDTTCTFNKSTKIKPTSIPGTIKKSLGGVAYNVTKASLLRGKKLAVTSKIISSVGKSEFNEISNKIDDEFSESFNIPFDKTGLYISNRYPSGNYVAMHDSSGELLVACSDMEIFNDIRKEFIEETIKSSNPKCVLFDGNIGHDQIDSVIKSARECKSIVGFEPTSVSKAASIAKVPFHLNSKLLKGVIPNNTIDFAFPNYYELTSLHEELSKNEYFDVENWFPIIDSLSLGDIFRSKIRNLGKIVPQIQTELEDGIVLKAIQILPYIPNLFVKLGSKGLLLFQLIYDHDQIDIHKQTTGSTKVIEVCQTSNNLALLIQYFPSCESDVINVTGAGDTLCGFLLAELAADQTWLYDNTKKISVMAKALLAAKFSVETTKSVSSRLLEI